MIVEVELTPRAQIERGRHAARLLGDSVLQDAMLGARERLTHEWQVALTPVEREDLWSRVQGLREVEKTLRTFVNAGELAEVALEAREKE